MQEIIKQLIDLTLEKKYEAIYKILNTYNPTTKKGMLFEIYITKLLNGNGYLAKHIGKPHDKGGDILLLDKRNSSYTTQIIQVKNQNKPLNKDALALVIEKFNREARAEYSCKYFSVYSLNGYYKSCHDYEEFNIKLNNWSNIKELITNYQINPPTFKVPLLPHNQITFEKILDMWEKDKKVCAIQATGTGKTFLIVNAILTQKGKKIVLAPFDKILAQISKQGAWNDASVDYYTYNSLSYKSLEELNQMSYNLIILDEFHRCGAKKWGKAVDLLLKNNPNAKVLGTTATPIRYDGNDMSEILFNNRIATKISLPEAIVRDILPQPKYVVALYEIDEIIKRMDQQITIFDKNNRIKDKYRKEIKTFKIEWEKARGMSNILSKHISFERKFIVFCKDYIHLKKMRFIVANWFQKTNIANNIKTYETTSYNKIDGDKEIRLFEKADGKDEFHLLFTINRLNEGLHISSVDGVLLLRSTNSHRIYLQQIGRAFDAKNEKKPLIFDLVNNFETLNEINFIKDIEKAQDIHNKKRITRNLEPKKATFKFNDETKQILNFKEEFEKRLEDPWYWMYEELILFKSDSGHVLTYFMNTSQLKNWCYIQRQNYERGFLIKQKTKLLLEIGFYFSNEEDEWQSHFLLAKKHYDKYHQLLINHPDSNMMPNSLKEWIIIQKDRAALGKLNNNKVELLASIHFQFTDEQEKWFEMYNEARKHFISTGFLWFYNQNIIISNELKNWLISQRELLNNNQLANSLQSMLIKIGFGLDKNKEDTIISEWKRETEEKEWMQQYLFIKSFYEEEINKGILVINESFVEEDSQWLIKQQELFSQGNLSSNKIDLLYKIGFEIDIEKVTFTENAQQFSKNPNENKKWGDYIYTLFENNQLKNWQRDILIKENLYEPITKYMHSPQQKLIVDNKNKTVDIEKGRITNPTVSLNQNKKVTNLYSEANKVNLVLDKEDIYSELNPKINPQSNYFGKLILFIKKVILFQ